MTLRELEGEFYKIVDDRTYRTVETLAEADGIVFLCPKCFEKNSGPVGTHCMICWRPRVPLTFSPGPGRWEMFGTSIDDLTLDNGPGQLSSVLIDGPGCGAHFHIQKGQIVPC